MAHQSTGSLPLPVNSRVTMLVELPRRVALWISLLAIGLASLLDASAASAGTLVEFPNLPGQTPEDLNGYLAQALAAVVAWTGGRPRRLGALEHPVRAAGGFVDEAERYVPVKIPVDRGEVSKGGDWANSWLKHKLLPMRHDCA